MATFVLSAPDQVRLAPTSRHPEDIVLVPAQTLPAMVASGDPSVRTIRGWRWLTLQPVKTPQTWPAGSKKSRGSRQAAVLDNGSAQRRPPLLFFFFALHLLRIPSFGPRGRICSDIPHTRMQRSR